MMTYTQWFDAHADKHCDLVKRLLSQGLNQEEIIEYFRFENMVEKEKSFCELYASGKKCHDMEELNCYLCACPNFRFMSTPQIKEDKHIHSYCAIESKDGALFEHEGNVHQDCSGCLVPHHVSYVKNNFDLDWKKIMQACQL